MDGSGGGFGRGWVSVDELALRQAQDERELCPETPRNPDRPHPNLSPEREGLSDTSRHDGWTAPRRVRFLDALARHGNVRVAAGAVGLAHQTAYRLRRRDATFAAGWDAALVLARDVAEQVLAERAIHGVEEIVFYRGEEVGRRRRFDARLLLAHLARLDARADDPATLRHAERFDDLLGAIGAGLSLEPMVDERARALASGADETPGLVFPQLDRAMFVSDEGFRERVDAYDMGDDEEPGWGADGGDEDGGSGEEAGEDGPGEDGPGEKGACDPVWQGACDRARLAAPWDAQFAASCAAVDALVAGNGAGGEDEEQEPPREYKSRGFIREGAAPGGRGLDGVVIAVQDRGTFGTFGASRRPWAFSARTGSQGASAVQVHTASGGRLIRIASMLPPVLRPNSVPRS